MEPSIVDGTARGTFSVDSEDACGQAAAIAQGGITSEELLHAYLSRIHTVNDVLNAFVSIQRRRALNEARKMDQWRSRLAKQGRLPPFYGVPIGVKDLNFVRRTWTRMGSRGFVPFFSPFDDRTSRSLRRAGFIIVGKLATSELGAMPVTEPDIHPPTRNPYDLGRTPGGSSGGSGAAVAGGLLPIAHGSDAGGSIRIPAAFCGLFGFKPSRGVVPNAYGLDASDLLYSCGPMGRSVRDLRAMVDVLSRRALAPAQAQRSLRICYSLDNPLVSTREPWRKAVLRVVEALEQAGHQLQAAPMFDGQLRDFLPLYQRLMAQVPLVLDYRCQRVTRWLRKAGSRVKSRDARRQHRSVCARIDQWFSQSDLWITPTVAVSPPAIGAFRNLDAEEAFLEAARLGAFTAAFNVSGQPAGTIPVGTDDLGLPIGVQIVGRRGADSTVLALMEALSAAIQPLAAVRPVYRSR